MCKPTGWLVILMFSGTCATTPDRPVESGRAETTTISVPIELHRGHPVVDVMVDGVGPFRFLVDTGTGISCVTPQFASMVPLPPQTR